MLFLSNSNQLLIKFSSFLVHRPQLVSLGWHATLCHKSCTRLLGASIQEYSNLGSIDFDYVWRRLHAVFLHYQQCTIYEVSLLIKYHSNIIYKQIYNQWRNNPIVQYKLRKLSYLQLSASNNLHTNALSVSTMGDRIHHWLHVIQIPKRIHPHSKSMIWRFFTSSKQF